MNGPTAAPLVSIGVPVYNGEAFLQGALDALRGQTYEHLEIIICDNASTDATPEIARAAAGEDDRVVVHGADRNRGASWNFNRAVGFASGQLFTWASYDDLRAPEAVERCVEALEAGGPGTVLAYPGTMVIDDDGTPLGPYEDGLDLVDAQPSARLRRLLRMANEYHPIFGVMRTAALRDTALLGSFVASDVVLLAELALAGRWVELPDRMFLRRFHERTSLKANPDLDDRAAWFDPDRRGGTRMPCARLGTELLKAVARTPLPAPERLRALVTVLGSWYAPNWRTIGGEAKRVARQALPRPATARG